MDQLKMNGVKEDSTQVDNKNNQEETETEMFIDTSNGPDLLEDQDEFNHEDDDPELEEDPEKIQCFECKGHGEYDNSICSSCYGMGYVLRNDIISGMKENIEINQELLISLISILHPLTKAFHDSSLNRNDLARKNFMNAAGIANEIFTKLLPEDKPKNE